MVQLLVGPVEGLVSQNCVCNKSPPGASKQHKFETTEVLWQDAGPVVEHPEETDLLNRPRISVWPKKGEANAVLTKLASRSRYRRGFKREMRQRWRKYHQKCGQFEIDLTVARGEHQEQREVG